MQRTWVTKVQTFIIGNKDFVEMCILSRDSHDTWQVSNILNAIMNRTENTDFSWPKSSLETIWCNGVRRGARSSLGRPRRATSCTPGMRSRSWRRREWGKCTMYSISIIDFWSSTLCNQDMNEPGPGGIDVYFSGAMEKWLSSLFWTRCLFFYWCWYFALKLEPSINNLLILSCIRQSIFWSKVLAIFSLCSEKRSRPPI